LTGAPLLYYSRTVACAGSNRGSELNWKKEEKRAYKTVRVVLKAVGMMLLIFTLTLPAIVFPEYKIIETTGQYQVAAVSYTYTDTNRIETYTDTGENRKLNVEFWYPENAEGIYPLIVFPMVLLVLKLVMNLFIMSLQVTAILYVP
jgi:hypothetical protein